MLKYDWRFWMTTKQRKSRKGVDVFFGLMDKVLKSGNKGIVANSELAKIYECNPWGAPPGSRGAT